MCFLKMYLLEWAIGCQIIAVGMEPLGLGDVED